MPTTLAIMTIKSSLLLLNTNRKKRADWRQFDYAFVIIIDQQSLSMHNWWRRVPYFWLHSSTLSLSPSLTGLNTTFARWPNNHRIMRRDSWIEYFQFEFMRLVNVNTLLNLTAPNSIYEIKTILERSEMMGPWRPTRHWKSYYPVYYKHLDYTASSQKSKQINPQWRKRAWFNNDKKLCLSWFQRYFKILCI